MAKSKNRMSNEINASSMADIAFLLLIFFLVTTTIDVDKGILNKLPPWDVPPVEQEANRRNVLIVLINAQDKLLVNNELLQISELRKKAKEFIDNRGRKPNLSDSPQEAVISLQNDRGTSYDMYIQVQNELKAAYRELRDAYAMQRYGKLYKDLDKEAAKMVAKEYPLRLSEAEPKAIGEQ
ncbi:MAG: biopolymer transporter ExbD [Chitinophagales bacterium]|nr:MAG: biopolymer transporter ExbD [Chitinophagales bacterium]